VSVGSSQAPSREYTLNSRRPPGTPTAPDSDRHRAGRRTGPAPDQRPTDDNYGRYVRLAADYRDRGYADDAAAFGFAI
jgi:hypothetical protein